jgi:hypothetical protein
MDEKLIELFVGNQNSSHPLCTKVKHGKKKEKANMKCK